MLKSFVRPLSRPVLWIMIIALLAAAPLGCSSSTSSPEAAAPAASSSPALRDDQALRRLLDEVIGFTQARYMVAEQNDAWQIVHGILAYGPDLKIYARGQLVPALDWLLKGGELKGWTMRPGDHGLEAVLEAGSKSGQGHEDQWIGYLAQCGLQPEDPIIVRGQTFKIQDLLTQAQWDIYPGMEASWTLMALSTYLPVDAKWTSKDGSEWTLDRIAGLEAREDLDKSACGGSHRMYGLAMALNNYLADGGKLSGGWLAANEKIKDAIDKAHHFQQPDGNFSTSFFQRPGSSPDIATELHATGHTFEFLTMAMTDAQLREPWVRRGAAQLCQLLEETRNLDVECGALYHAAHGLILYRARMFGASTPSDSTGAASTAEAADSTTQSERSTAHSPEAARAR